LSIDELAPAVLPVVPVAVVVLGELPDVPAVVSACDAALATRM
jgi:threonine/homoserine/homoserine lactone efflux protein